MVRRASSRWSNANKLYQMARNPRLRHIVHHADLVIPEWAMACGTPVVASRLGGLQHLVEDGAHGFLVPPADPEAIASRVYQLLTETELRARMGARGVEDARKHDVRRQARRVLDVYEQVIRPAG